MTKCNGCGEDVTDVAMAVVYGNPAPLHGLDRPQSMRDECWEGDYDMTLCPDCKSVLDHIIRNSDLGDHHGEHE